MASGLSRSPRAVAAAALTYWSVSGFWTRESLRGFKARPSPFLPRQMAAALLIWGSG